MAVTHGSVEGRRPPLQLLLVKLIGVTLFLGGLSALTGVGLIGPEPDTREGWQVLRETIRAVVRFCMLPGFLLIIAGGLGLYLRNPARLRRRRWFRLAMSLVLVATPSLHFASRGRTLAFAEAVRDDRLADAGREWRTVTLLFAVSLLVYGTIAAIGRFKPGLGEDTEAPGPRGDPPIDASARS